MKDLGTNSELETPTCSINHNTGLILYTVNIGMHCSWLMPVALSGVVLVFNSFAFRQEFWHREM